MSHSAVSSRLKTMRQVFRFIFGLTTALHVLADVDSYRGRFEEIDGRLDRITQRIVKIENGLSVRRDSGKIDGLGALDRRFQAIQGTGCRENYFQCGGNDPQCVNNLLVCDGHKDCRNGVDEDDCSLPFRSGDTYSSRTVHFFCGFKGAKKCQIKIGSIEVLKWFKPIAKVQLIATFPTDYDNHEDVLVMISIGYYSFATRILEVTWSVSERLGSYVDFNDSTIKYLSEESVCGIGTIEKNV